VQNREKVAWALAGVLALSFIATAVVAGVIAYESDTTTNRAAVSEQTPDPTATPQNGFERTAAELIKATANSDVEGYLALIYPPHRPTEKQLRDSFNTGPIDVAGCDTSGAKFRMTEVNAGVSLDVTFAHPCGDFGATGSCTMFFERQDAAWWVEGLGCDLVSAVTPVPP